MFLAERVSKVPSYHSSKICFGSEHAFARGVRAEVPGATGLRAYIGEPLVRDEGVAGSNPATPTKQTPISQRFLASAKIGRPRRAQFRALIGDRGCNVRNSVSRPARGNPLQVWTVRHIVTALPALTTRAPFCPRLKQAQPKVRTSLGSPSAQRPPHVRPAGRYGALGLMVRTNAQVASAVLESIAKPDAGGLALLRKASEAMRLSARSYHRVPAGRPHSGGPRRRGCGTPCPPCRSLSLSGAHR
jgi:magnesium chelatase subunit ChlI-like protein